MNRSKLILVVATALVFSTPTFAQRSHPSPGGPPSSAGAASSNHGSANASGMSGSHESGPAPNGDMTATLPSTVFTNNSATAANIQGLTGHDAQTARNRFQNRE